MPRNFQNCNTWCAARSSSFNEAAADAAEFLVAQRLERGPDGRFNEAAADAAEF